MEGKESLVYDLSIIKEASEDIDYLKEITGYFIQNSGAMLEALEKAYKDADWDEVQNAAHKLSSNFYMFGLNEGAKALATIDVNLKNKVVLKKMPDLILIAKRQGELAIKQLKRDFHDLL